MRQICRFFIYTFNNYSKLVLAVAIPVAILTIIQADGNLGDFGLLMGFALAFMSLAVIEYGSNKVSLENKKITTVYTSGSGRFLQFLGTFFIMVFFSVPAVALFHVAGWVMESARSTAIAWIYCIKYASVQKHIKLISFV